MRYYIAIFKVPDDLTPQPYKDNADGYFLDKEAKSHIVGAHLKSLRQYEKEREARARRFRECMDELQEEIEEDNK